MIRISEHQLHHLIARLSERAMTVLRFLSQQRFATTSHLARLLRPHHTSPASALRQTSRLTKHLATLHLIRALTRRIGGMRAGSGATIWHLTEPGHRLITRHDADTGTPTRRRWHEPSLSFLTHTLANGHTIQLHLSRRAKKNIILRAHSEHSLRLSIPPQLSMPELRRWLQHNETALQQMLRRSPAPATAPSHLWLYGQPHQLQSHAQAAIQIQPGRILLPAAEWPQQQALLRERLEAAQKKNGRPSHPTPSTPNPPVRPTPERPSLRPNKRPDIPKPGNTTQRRIATK